MPVYVCALPRDLFGAKGPFLSANLRIARYTGAPDFLRSQIAVCAQYGSVEVVSVDVAVLFLLPRPKSRCQKPRFFLGWGGGAGSWVGKVLGEAGTAVGAGGAGSVIGGRTV